MTLFASRNGHGTLTSLLTRAVNALHLSTVVLTHCLLWLLYLTETDSQSDGEDEDLTDAEKRAQQRTGPARPTPADEKLPEGSEDGFSRIPIRDLGEDEDEEQDDGQTEDEDDDEDDD